MDQNYTVTDHRPEFFESCECGLFCMKDGDLYHWEDGEFKEVKFNRLPEVQ